jgi:NAD(P)H-nitrite reductase large subunit
MSAVLEHNSLHAETATATPVVVVVGTGPSGIRFVEQLLQRSPDTPIVIYGNEPWEPYNRVRLAGLLTGEVDFAGIQNPLRLPLRHRVVQRHNCEIVSIDRERRLVYDHLGNSQSYSHLVLATGSHPHIPNMEGIDKTGVFTFRNLDDAERLIARRTRARHAVILGGGLLGLEAARGLQKHHTAVTVIEHAGRLMAQQLDDEGAELLRERILALGIQVTLGDSVKRVLGDTHITGVELLSGRSIACDTLVIATGIRPNLALARNAGISVGRGIRVNDRMQTSDERVYAIGECAQHRERIYGLVAPGLEQAAVAAHHVAGGSSCYSGSHAVTRLKVIGVKVFSAGRTGEHEAIAQLKTLSWRSSDNRSYRKLLLQRHRLVGAIACGEWDESSRVQESVQRTRYLWPWQYSRFLQYGRLWPEREAADVRDWPAGAVVCQCTGVTRGTLGAAIQAGHRSIEDLCAHTGAAGVCGSCKPLLAELAGDQPLAPEAGSRTLVWTGIVALLAALAILLAPALPFPDSVQAALRWDLLWRESLLKQISGFSLLGLGAAVSLISLRKRTRSLRFGAFSSWRLVHVLLGTLAVATLVAHTGLRLGYHLNFYLMLCFTGLLLAGAVAGGVTGWQHALPRVLVKRVRDGSLWLHIVLLWPLPALLGFHILKTYWF